MAFLSFDNVKKNASLAEEVADIMGKLESLQLLSTKLQSEIAHEKSTNAQLEETLINVRTDNKRLVDELAEEQKNGCFKMSAAQSEHK